MHTTKRIAFATLAVALIAAYAALPAGAATTTTTIDVSNEEPICNTVGGTLKTAMGSSHLMSVGRSRPRT